MKTSPTLQSGSGSGQALGWPFRDLLRLSSPEMSKSPALAPACFKEVWGAVS